MVQGAKDVAKSLAEEINRQLKGNENSNSSVNPSSPMGTAEDPTPGSNNGIFTISKSATSGQEHPESREPRKMPSPEEIKEQRVAMVVRDQRKDPQLWRDLIAYWLLGLCNNLGYVVMLSAAHDIIEGFSHPHNENVTVEATTGRECNIASTGTILLADIIPALIVKFLAPFIPFWIHIRVLSAIGLAGAGFLLVGFANAEWVALFGVVCTSLSSGLGETTLLAYSSRFNRNVVSTWSSGTGGAGIIGSLSYAGLKSMKTSPITTMLIMLVFPLLEAISFWVILRKPSKLPVYNYSDSSLEDMDSDEKPLMDIGEKFRYSLRLLKYMVPLTLVYLFEYFINQGLFELVFFKDIFLDKSSQYRWLNVDYQIGVFISRSSVNLYKINKIWLMSALQCINVIYFLMEAIFYITPNIWIVFLIVFWEGLLGGGAYVNTFYKMSKEISPVRRQFALGVVAQSDSFGIALAGIAAIPLHNLICALPAPVRPYVF